MVKKKITRKQLLKEPDEFSDLFRQAFPVRDHAQK